MFLRAFVKLVLRATHLAADHDVHPPAESHVHSASCSHNVPPSRPPVPASLVPPEPAGRPRRASGASAASDGATPDYGELSRVLAQRTRTMAEEIERLERELAFYKARRDTRDASTGTDDLYDIDPVLHTPPQARSPEPRPVAQGEDMCRYESGAPTVVPAEQHSALNRSDDRTPEPSRVVPAPSPFLQQYTSAVLEASARASRSSLNSSQASFRSSFSSAHSPSIASSLNSSLNSSRPSMRSSMSPSRYQHRVPYSPERYSPAASPSRAPPSHAAASPSGRALASLNDTSAISSASEAMPTVNLALLDSLLSPSAERSRMLSRSLGNGEYDDDDDDNDDDDGANVHVTSGSPHRTAATVDYSLIDNDTTMIASIQNKYLQKRQ